MRQVHWGWPNIKRVIQAQGIGQEETSYTLKPSNNLTNHQHKPTYFRLTNQQCLPRLQLRIPPAILDALHRLRCVCTDLPCLALDSPALCNLLATISQSSLKNGISNARTLDLPKLNAVLAFRTIASPKSRKLSSFSPDISRRTGSPSNPMSRNSIGPKTNQRIPWRPSTS